MGKLHKIREYVMSLYFPVLLSIPISFSNTTSFIEKYVFRDWEFLKYLMILIVIDTLVSWVYHIKNKDFSSKGFSMIITKLFIYSAILIVSHVMGNFTVEGGNLITDGRFSGSNRGLFVGHISPEACEGGLLALVEDGDEIALDIAGRTLELHVDETIIAARRALWKPVEKAFPRGFMDLYRDRASSAAEGAMLL